MKETKESKNVSIWIIVLVGLLIIATCVVTVYFTNKRNVLANKSNNENNISVEVAKAYFEDYLKIFEDMGYEWSIRNEEDLEYFWVMSYLNNNENELIELTSDSEYDSYLQIRQAEVRELMYKYFGINYTLKEYEGEYFYAIKLSGENANIYIKHTDSEKCDLEVTDVSFEGNNVTVNLNMSCNYYDPAYAYKGVVSLEYKEGNYFIKDVKFFDFIWQDNNL